MTHQRSFAGQDPLILTVPGLGSSGPGPFAGMMHAAFLLAFMVVAAPRVTVPAPDPVKRPARRKVEQQDWE